MKRLIAILLLAALLLAGCAAQPAPTETATEPAPTLPPPKEYTVTSSGIPVRTDYSGYTAEKQTVTPRFTRLSDGAMSELTARDDYGTLYPFIGGVSESDFSTAGMYAFADAQGRIVTDPVFSRVSLLRNADRTKGVWCYRKVSPEEFTDDSGYSYLVGSELNGIATEDGSFTTNCRYERICGGDNILMCIYPQEDSNTPRFDVYDYDGRLLLTSEELPYADRLYGRVWCFDCVDDYLVVGLHSGEYEDWGDSNRREIEDLYLSDLNGNLKFGPYSYVNYREGEYIYVTLKDKTAALLKADGSYLFGGSFSLIGYNAPDRFLVKREESSDYQVLDAEGNEIFTVPNASYFSWDGVGYVSSTYDPYSQTYYDRDGNKLTLPTQGDWTRLGLTDIFITQSSNGNALFNLETGESVPVAISAEDYVEPCDWENLEFPYIAVNKSTLNEGYSYFSDTAVYDNRMQEKVLEFRGRHYMIHDIADGTPYFVAVTGSACTLYNAEMEPVRTLHGIGDQYSSIMVYDGAISCYDDRASYVYDAEGNELICYPLYSLLND